MVYARSAKSGFRIELLPLGGRSIPAASRFHRPARMRAKLRDDSLSQYETPAYPPVR
jgi:hypothetical protein